MGTAADHEDRRRDFHLQASDDDALAALLRAAAVGACCGGRYSDGEGASGPCDAAAAGGAAAAVAAWPVVAWRVAGGAADVDDLVDDLVARNDVAFVRRDPSMAAAAAARRNEVACQRVATAAVGHDAACSAVRGAV